MVELVIMSPSQWVIISINKARLEVEDNQHLHAHYGKEGYDCLQFNKSLA